MKKLSDRNRFRAILIILLICSIMTGSAFSVKATDSSFSIDGTIYTFEQQNSHYEFSESSGEAITPTNSFGSFTVSGKAVSIGLENGVPAYDVKSGNLDFTYLYQLPGGEVDETKWHLTEDRSKMIDTLTLDGNILNGAIIIQTSLDKETWITDTTYTNVFKDGSFSSKVLYSTKDIQLVNGCYYRFIIAYEQRIKGEKGQFLFVSYDNFAYRKVIEIYELYAEDSAEKSLGAPTSESTPRKELGTKAKTGTDTGFSGTEVIDQNDPHFGWDLGTFVVNGYTRETAGTNGQPVFLKNLGDKVTLWFRLDQDINCLNGNTALSIEEDKNGYDQKYEIPKTNFKHGALIIQYTDYQGNKHDPILYTDYLAANVRTGADTKVVLFEEGDYEISLNYEINNSPLIIGARSPVATYTDYQISFSFSVRNGNCMVYPFDTVTQAELSNGSVTPNGFRLDLARSRYLTIDVTYSMVNETEQGLVEDVRFNRPAKDGDTYTNEGIYTFKVKNLYTGEETQKTIYVGSNPYLTALSKNELTVEALSERIKAGAKLNEDGTLIEAVVRSGRTSEPTAEESARFPWAIVIVAVIIAAAVIVLLAIKKSNGKAKPEKSIQEKEDADQ